MKNKKILLLGLNGRGGTLQYASHVASGLSKFCSTTLFLPSYSDVSLISKKVKLIKITAPPNTLKTIVHTLDIAQHIRAVRSLNRENADVINILDIHPWYILYWPFLNGKKYVTINDPQPHSGEAGFLTMLMIRIVTKFMLKNADKIIVLGAKQADTIRKLGYKQDIIVSRIGSYEFFTRKNPRKYQSESNTLLFFGRIREYKGLKYLLNALIRLKKSKIGFKLIVAGEGNISSYSKKLRELGGNVELLNGYVPNEKVSEYFQRCAFVVMPYTDATQTGVVQVAYSFRKPVIATDVGSLPEIVVNGKTGRIIPPRDSDALAAAIVEMLKNKNKTAQMGANGQKYMRKELNWTIIIRKLYRDITKT